MSTLGAGVLINRHNLLQFQVSLLQFFECVAHELIDAGRIFYNDLDRIKNKYVSLKNRKISLRSSHCHLV